MRKGNRFQPALSPAADHLTRELLSMFEGIPKPSIGSYERSVYFRAQQRRVPVGEYLMTLLGAAVRSGQSLERLQRFGHAWNAMAERLVGDRDGQGDDREILIRRFRELSHEEALADGRADAEVLDALADPCPKEVAEAAREVARNARLRAEQREILDRLAVADLAPLTLTRA